MSSFGFSSTTDDVLEGVDLSGTLAVVTGASTGLGEETTRALAAHGARVVMAVRDPERGEAAAGRIRASVGDDGRRWRSAPSTWRRWPRCAPSPTSSCRNTTASTC